MSIEEQVAAHYGRNGLEEALLAALAAAGKDVDRLSAADLRTIDEFHLGGFAATIGFAEALAFPAGTRILDIGAGIGGPARYLAETHGVTVTGIDLTEEYVALGNALNRRVGLAGHVELVAASALALPFDDAAFDGATMIHVGMNIADKARLFAEARRALKPGARFGIYDAMRAGAGDLPFPLPWARTPATSFVEPPETYRRLLAGAGFDIVSDRERTGEVTEILRREREKIARDGMPALNRHILSGPDWAERSANIRRALDAGLVAPVEIIARAA